ncbi:hypothetical protein MBAV_002022, partial [Candidatus Magnetobacterium bavaricum]
MQHTVEQAILYALDRYHFPGADKFVRACLDAGKMLIILDGLDEVGDAREFVSKQIRNFCRYDERQGVSNRLIVTCRELAYDTQDLRDVIQ